MTSLTSESSSEHNNGRSKRNRAQLSCTACRHGKLRCDRQVPCSQCVKKGRSATCTTPAPMPRKRPVASMQNRLRHLESLVKGVMTGETPQSIDNGSPTSPGMVHATETRLTSQSSEIHTESMGIENISQGISDSLARMSAKDSFDGGPDVLIGTSQSTFVGGTHWAAILEDIEDVKEYFEEMEDGQNEEPEMNFSTINAITFNYQQTATKSDLVGALPPKFVVDRLIARYFNCHSPLISILHKSKFEKEYQTFWSDPIKAPVSYIALIFALIAISSFAMIGANEQHPDTRGLPVDMIRSYRGSCLQALILSEYTRPGPYTMETLFLHLEGEFLFSKDGTLVPYLMIGTIVRLALRIGLHRDPSKAGGNFTPFQAEMRRRIWHLIAQMDMLGSFHVGLPGQVGAIESDVEYPRNLRDEDFNEDTKELPPPRPASEFTSISYMICKSILCHECTQVASFAHSLKPRPYENVLELDQALHAAFEKVPAFYRFGPTGISIFESPNVVTKQFSLFLLYHKARCMLHRKYFILANSDQRYENSRKEALDAAKQLLWGQSMTYESAIAPGGPLSNDKWFLSTLATHDFLLAAMILYTRIMQIIPRQQDQYEVSEMIAAIERSHHAWGNTNEASAKKARNVSKAMLTKIRAARAAQSGKHQAKVKHGYNQTDQGVEALSLGDIVGHDNSIITDHELDQWMNIDNYDETSQSSGDGLLMNKNPMPLSAPFNTFIDVPGNIDWDMFDDEVWPRTEGGENWPLADFPDFQASS